MQVDFAGEITSCDNVKAGDIFSLSIGDDVALGMKLNASKRDVLVLSGGVPYISESPIPPFVYLIKGACLSVEAEPSHIVSEVKNPTRGTVLITAAEQFICADDRGGFDTKRTADPRPALLNIADGKLCYITQESTAVFTNWRIVVKRGDWDEEILQFPQIEEDVSA